MILDGHNDLLLRLWRGRRPIHLELETARETGFAGGFFALFAPSGPAPDEGVSAYSLPPAEPIARAEAARIVDEQFAVLFEQLCLCG